jgi:hypothetical protein
MAIEFVHDLRNDSSSERMIRLKKKRKEYSKKANVLLQELRESEPKLYIKWAEQVEANLTRFKELRSRNSNIQLQVCTTVNVFNVYYIAEVARWIDQQGFDFVYWNMMHEAYYFSIGTLPDLVKATISSRLATADVTERTRLEFNNIIKFMNSGASMDGFMLRMKISDLDCKRNQNLANVEPEFAELIEYAGPI